MSNLSPETRVLKAHIDIQKSRRPGLLFWGPVVALGSWKMSTDIPTACTDGWDAMYNPEYIASLRTKQEVAGVVLHEAIHKGLRHLTLWRRLFMEDPDLANRACDYVVNDIIVRADPNHTEVCLPLTTDRQQYDALYEPSFSGMDSLHIFRLIQKQKKQQSSSGGGSQSSSGGGSQSRAGVGPQSRPGTATESIDKHDWDGARRKQSEATQRTDKTGDREAELARALRAGAAAAKQATGSGSGAGVPAELNDLLSPAINWTKALREFFSSCCDGMDDATFNPPNRRFHAQGLVLPSPVSETPGPIVVAPDLSGSMWGGSPPYIQRMLSEAVGIAKRAKPEALHLLYWDTAVTRAEHYERGQYDRIVTGTKPVGGGGTDPQCVAKYIADHKIKPACIVVMTDGHVASWGKDWGAPVLWLVLDNPAAKPTHGRVIHVSKRQLEE